MSVNQLKGWLGESRVTMNASIPVLIETSLLRGEGFLTTTGALGVSTGKYTGRSPKDKYLVQDSFSSPLINWGPVNQIMSEKHFQILYQDVQNYLASKELFISDGYAGSDPQYRQSIRTVNELAWQNIFIRQLLIRPAVQDLTNFVPDFHLICAPGFQADPKKHGTNSEAAVVLNLTRKLIIIVGTSYAGEMKKSIFSLMNFLLPRENVLSMHCSANVGEQEDVALFFGLSGTGKTTLSADPARHLIGDDEHGWSDNGAFNIEGGCYAKCIGLSSVEEPQIWQAIRFGSVLENVVIDKNTRVADYQSKEYTENTRCAYPVEHIPNPVIPGIAGVPKTIFFLTADAFGVLPPIAVLNKGQAMYHFLSGYTSKLAGTERGIKEPQATFSECFGAPFLPLPPVQYANLLGTKLNQYGTKVFLLNTGWTGGPYGVGERFKISYTRALIKAALEGHLNDAPTRLDPIFGFQVPKHCPGVPDDILDPRSTWPNSNDYQSKAYYLAGRFIDNFSKFKDIPHHIQMSAPKIPT